MQMVSLEQQQGESREAPSAPAPPRPPSALCAPVPGARRCILVVALAAAGCATTGSRGAPSSPAAEPERVVIDLQAKNAGYLRRIEELENRIFILEDQLDSRALAAEQRAPATLPSARVVRGNGRASVHGGGSLKASSPAPAELASGLAGGGTLTAGSPSGEEASTPVQTSIVAEHAVDYAGDALQGAPVTASADAPGTRRPLLRLSAEVKARERSERNAIVRSSSTAPEPPTDSRLVVPLRTVADPLGVYREALETLRAGRPALALAGFRRFLDANPQHDYADNAQYWIGECHYDQQQFRAAERAFRNVVERYPHGNKVPDAMLKLGFTMQSLGDDAGGRAVLESLARAFPKHEAARLASERLAHPEPPLGRAGQPAMLGTILPLPAAQMPPAIPAGEGGEHGERGSNGQR